MKKSFLFAALAILVTICTLTAGNLKLKNEYSSGHIHSPFTTTNLPAFSYVKETLSTAGPTYKSFHIYVKPGQASSVSIYFDRPDVYRYHVINDTLFIDNDAAQERDYDNLPIYLTCSELKKIIVATGSFSIRESAADSLSIIATSGSRVDIVGDHLKNIFVEASGKSAISFSGIDTVLHASLSFKDSSNLHISDVVIKEKSLHMDKLTSLLLSGRSVENFGVKKN